MNARIAVAFTASLLLLPMTAAIAQDASPLGQWQVASGESRFRISKCGGGEELCAKLTWLREDVRNGANLAALNTYVVRGAREVSENTWTGEYVFEGKSYVATMKMVSPDKMRVNSCSGMFCNEVELQRR